MKELKKLYGKVMSVLTTNSYSETGFYFFMIAPQCLTESNLAQKRLTA